MEEKPGGRRVDTGALVIGYAMSRLDRLYLEAFGLASWRAAFAHAEARTGRPGASFKNLRDEFDPVHSNSRKGWRLRPLRADRQRVLADLCGVSDHALIELTRRILDGDEASAGEALDSLAESASVAGNIAERLLTGRLAEDFFLARSESIIGFKPGDIEDLRLAARGFDFGVRPRPELAVEVKGLRKLRGEILFTDREWSEAGIRGRDYWLVVIGNLAETPVPRLIENPQAELAAACRIQRTVAASWSSRVVIPKP